MPERQTDIGVDTAEVERATAARPATRPAAVPARERLILAATELLAASDGKPVSTRQITDVAGVTAPTLYHHFKDKDGLMDAVVARGFEDFVRREASLERSPRAITDVKRLWDVHVQFGLSHTQLYSLMFGNSSPKKRPMIVSEAERLLERELERIALDRQLAVPPLQAARAILAANIGVTLMLIADSAESHSADSGTSQGRILSHQTRDAVLRSVVTEPSVLDGDSADDPDDDGASASASGPPSYVAAAIALNATLQSSHPDQLSGTEMKLFLEWLHRLSSASPPGER